MRCFKTTERRRHEAGHGAAADSRSGPPESFSFFAGRWRERGIVRLNCCRLLMMIVVGDTDVQFLWLVSQFSPLSANFAKQKATCTVCYLQGMKISNAVELLKPQLQLLFCTPELETTMPHKHTRKGEDKST